jgi:legumain
VIVAGSKDYMNYRHQADACHAFHVVRNKGIPAEHIIVMAYDDIAKDEMNPFRGKLFNKPDPTGAGLDVYEGCDIDYRAKEVTPFNFLRVLQGGLEQKGTHSTKKVLRSTAEDNVFVFFSDHGAPGLIAFPDSELHKFQLHAALAHMSKAKMFKKLVFYLESCESGSMFQGLNVSGVYAVSAANPSESSWGAYCSGNDDVVNTTSLHTCLGDLFSVSWMQDSETNSGNTLEEQFKRVKARTNKSHVMQWGDLSFTNDSILDFIGSGRNHKEGLLMGKLGDHDDAAVPVEEAVPVLSAVSAREVDLQRLYRAYSAAEVASPERLRASERLHQELTAQQAAERAYQRFVALAFPGDEAQQRELWRASAPPDQPMCELATHATLREGCASQFDANSGFALQFHQVVVNACAFAAEGRFPVAVSGVAGLAAKVCSASPKVAAMVAQEIVV